MSLVLLCPGCRTRLTVDDDRAGTTFGCPRCATTISVPVGASPPAPTPAPARRPPPPPPAVPPPLELHDEPDPNYRPRRKRKARATGRWLALGVALALAVIGSVWLGTRYGRDGSGSVGADTGDRGVIRTAPHNAWTHKELLEHLETKGLKYTMHRTVLKYSFQGTGAYLARRSNPDSESGTAVESLYFKAHPDVIYVELRTTEQDARDQAGVLGDRSFAWGRFLFVGEASHLNQIRAALR